MAEARTRSNHQSAATSSVRKTKKRPKTIVTDHDKVRTTGHKASTVRVSSSTTRRGNSIRSTGR